MIVISPITNFMRAGRPARSAHLLSDLNGHQGVKELMGFAINIELKAAWMQKDMTAHEHFALVGDKIDAAITAGAVKADRHRLVKIIAEKQIYIDRQARTIPGLGEIKRA